MATTSKRVSVKAYQVAFLETFSTQVGTDDLSEILNWILTDYRQLKQGVPQPQAPQVIPFPRATSADEDLAEALLAAI